MKAIDVVKIMAQGMKMLSDADIRTEDYRHIPMYEEYLSMRQDKEKYRYIIAVLAMKYNLSQSSVVRIINRLSKAVKS